MMDPNRLWAKSKWDDEPETPSMFLPGHLTDVYQAAKRVLDATADDQLKALGLEPSIYGDRFRRIVLLAAAVHDLGKANDHFQGMIVGRRKDVPQGLRHEWLTLVILRLPEIRNWLRKADSLEETDWSIIEWVVSGHHPKYNRASPPKDAPNAGEGSDVQILLSHDDFRQCLLNLRNWFSLDDPPHLLQDWSLSLNGSEKVFNAINREYGKAKIEWTKLPKEMKRFVGAAKDCLIAADVAGSALPERIDPASRMRWIDEAFARRPSNEQLKNIVSVRLDGGDLHEFQKQVGASSHPVTFVRAGCGSGKTLAAYHWAATQHPGRRLFFCYPTTGTATEGFRDYLHSPEVDIQAELFHGRAAVDREIILNTADDDDEEGVDPFQRIASLDTWATPVAACTVDTVLGIMQNQRRGLYAWPALAGSAFCFDEIHSLDESLFGSLLRFLEEVPGVPVLLMTASLPRARKKALEEALNRRDPRCALHEIGGPEHLETRARYHKQSSDKHLDFVRGELERGGKVLWVSNTVKRVMSNATDLQIHCDIKPLIYHSRFRYGDRVRQHKAVIDAFRSSGPVVACCSQVAEMSLDLSATLLLSDLAPVPSIIQRLGRLARRLKEGEPTCPFVIIEPDSSLPYKDVDLKSARGWLSELQEVNLSQRSLADAWESHDKSPKPKVSDSAWMDGGPSTTVKELRDVTPGITILLESDRELVQSRAKRSAEMAIPMPNPRHLNWRSWKKCRGLPVAPTGTVKYHSEHGAEWA